MGDLIQATLAKIADPTINKHKTIFKIPPTHLNQVDGSFMVKLKMVKIIPIKQNTWIAIITIIGGSGKPSPALIFFGIIEKI